MQIALSAIIFQDIVHDTVVSINGTTYNISVAQLLTDYPQTYYIDKTSFGEDRVCITRIDGQPCTISALDINSLSYTPDIINYDILFPGHFSTHPIHRPPTK